MRRSDQPFWEVVWTVFVLGACAGLLLSAFSSCYPAAPWCTKATPCKVERDSAKTDTTHKGEG